MSSEEKFLRLKDYLNIWINGYICIEINYVIMMSRMNSIFGVGKFNKISKTFDNVINKLKSNSWIMETGSGYHYLNINQRTENFFIKISSKWY